MNINQNTEQLIQLIQLQSQLNKRLESPLSLHGINFSEYLVLYHLNQSPTGSLRRVELAERIGLTASGITRMLKPMQKIGLVENESSPRDARVSLVKITSGGNEIFSHSTNTLNDTANTMTKSMTEKQLQKVIENVEGILQTKQ